MERIRYRLVYNRRKRLNMQGKALIQVEASLNKRKVYFTTRIYIRPEEWDKRTSTIINHPHATELNAWAYVKGNVKNNRVIDLTFNAFSTSIIENSKRSNGAKCNLRGTLSALNEFCSGYTWEDLTRNFLKDFEIWLLNRDSASTP